MATENIRFDYVLGAACWYGLFRAERDDYRRVEPAQAWLDRELAQREADRRGLSVHGVGEVRGNAPMTLYQYRAGLGLVAFDEGSEGPGRLVTDYIEEGIR